MFIERYFIDIINIMYKNVRIGMLYIIYLPKIEKEDKRERKLLKMLEAYSKQTGYENSIISSPGFLSTKNNTIREFLENLSRIITNNNKVELGFMNGMNGNTKIKGSNKTIKEAHYKIMKQYNFDGIDIKVLNKRDHRKMMFFFTYKNEEHKRDVIKTKEEIDNFLDQICVNAVLIGSSNQSNVTYFSPVATKGEADIFMFNGKFKNKEINIESFNEIYKDSVITKSIGGIGDKDSDEFLNQILEDMLYSNL